MSKADQSVFVSLLLSVTPMAAQRGDRGQGSINQADPCVLLPDPLGNAKGTDKQCPGGGSSSGIAKGDFNGDGFADLAVGEPGATISGQASAGDLIVVYGSASGLAQCADRSSGTRTAYRGLTAASPTPSRPTTLASAL